jgi:hypothetical protein
VIGTSPILYGIDGTAVVGAWTEMFRIIIDGGG